MILVVFVQVLRYPSVRLPPPAHDNGSEWNFVCVAHGFEMLPEKIQRQHFAPESLSLKNPLNGPMVSTNFTICFGESSSNLRLDLLQ